MSNELLDSRSMTHQYTIPFHALGVTADGVAQGMGYGEGAIATPFADDLDMLVKEAADHAAIEVGFRVFPPEVVSVE
ncbi:MAG: hypothetical protein L3K26_02960, partial [Candidatus Hydrogenedentes bacterium]|nr:hypothetical protein [Candidatus Hydrogenedentota bacterium]